VYSFVFFCFCYVAFLGEFYYSNDIGGLCAMGGGLSSIMVCLRGLPPFRVFIIKVCVLLRLALTSGYIFVFFLLSATLLTLRYYLRLGVNSYIFFNRRKITKKLALGCSPFYLFIIVNFFSAYIIFI